VILNGIASIVPDSLVASVDSAARILGVSPMDTLVPVESMASVKGGEVILTSIHHSKLKYTTTREK